MHDQLRRLVVEVERDLRAVGLLLAERRVVRLEANGPARRHVGAGVGRHDAGLRAHCIAADRALPLGLGGTPVGRHLGHPAGEQVVHALARTGLHRRGAQPLALGQRVGQRRALVVDHARGRDGVGRDVQHQIRLAQRPLTRHVAHRAQRVGAVAARRSLLDPVDHRLHLVGRQPLVVGEFPDVRIGMIGRHPVGSDHLADHRGEALDHLVVGHGEGRDAALLVAGHALGFEDRRHVLGVGDLGDAALWEGDGRAAARDRVGDRQRIQRLGGRTARQRAAEGDFPALRVNHEDFGGPRHAQRFADQLVGVHQDRGVIAGLLGLRLDRLGSVLQA